MNNTKWADALIEYVAVCRVITKAEVAAIKKIMTNQKLSQIDAYTLLWSLETHPTTRLDTLDTEDFCEYLFKNHGIYIVSMGGL